MEDFLENGAVNWSKVTLLASGTAYLEALGCFLLTSFLFSPAFNTMQAFRSHKYQFSEDREIQRFLWHVRALTEDELYERCDFGSGVALARCRPLAETPPNR